MTTRLTPTVRALALVPLLAVAVDQARAVALCGSDASSCLEAAGRGWLGAWGIALTVLYSLGLGVLVARGARPRRPASFPRLWVVGTAGVAAACGGQALIAGAVGGAPLGGGWLGLLALCVLAGALIALVLRAAPELPRAPRLAALPQPETISPPRGSEPPRRPAPRRARGRAPPLTA